MPQEGRNKNDHRSSSVNGLAPELTGTCDAMGSASISRF
jgi:hypothetical protein